MSALVHARCVEHAWKHEQCTEYGPMKQLQREITCYVIDRTNMN